MSDLLEEIFSRAAAFETGGRHVDYIKLDITTRQIEVKLTAVPGGEYYETILARQQDTIQKAHQTHAVWANRHPGGVTEEDLTERVGLMLKSLLDTDFLLEDYYEITRSKRTSAKDELSKFGFEKEDLTDSRVCRYAVLRGMVGLHMGRFVFDNKKAIGNYMYENRDTFSPVRYGYYFSFETMLGLIYQDLDKLKKENNDSELKECVSKMTADLEPLRGKVAKDFAECYDTMLDEIFQIESLQKKLKKISPNTFKGGYNQKLACNLVGLFCSERVYDLNFKDADELIYPEINPKTDEPKTHYKYINNFVNFNSTDSELTEEEVQSIKNIIKKFT